MNIHNIIENTTAEGPGNRFAIWVQGCSRRCSGCFARETWSHEDNRVLSVGTITEMMARHLRDIEGITVLGGEPFEQPFELQHLLYKAKAMGLSTIVSTGYYYSELLNSKNDSVAKALKCIDVLADGPYVEKQKSFNTPMIGSSNQSLHFLTDRYCNDDFYTNRIQIKINKEGTMKINGMADFDQLKKELV